MKSLKEFINESLIKTRQRSESTFYNDGVLLHNGYIDDILFEEYVSLMSEGIKEMYSDDDEALWQSFVEGKYGVSDSFIHEDGYKAYQKRLNEAYICDAVNENVDDVIYKKKDGILWHLTSKDNADSILKNGLEVRTERKISTHPPRVYFLDLDTASKDIIAYKDILKGNNTDDYVLLKIDLKKTKHKYRFFKDGLSIDVDAYFTREPIPPHCISVANIDNIKKEKILVHIDNFKYKVKDRIMSLLKKLK